jgi:hypothetical protein
MDTYHEVEVNIVDAQALQRAFDALFDALVPRVVELGGDPDLLARYAGVLDALADLVLVAICKRSVDVSVTCLQSRLDGFADLVGFGLPRSQTNRRDLRSSVERESLLCPVLGSHSGKRTEHSTN